MVVGSPTVGPDMGREVLVEQWLPSPSEDAKYHIRVLRNGQLVECYVNNQVTLTYRVYEQVENMFGVFVDQGAASFDRVAIRSQQY
jgi:hypothetical protein